MALLTVITLAEDGLDDTDLVAAAGGGDTFSNDANVRTLLFVKNASGGAITVTATAQVTSKDVTGVGGMTKGNIVHSVPAGGESLIGPFTRAFNNASGQVVITYSGVTSLTVGPVVLENIK